MAARAADWSTIFLPVASVAMSTALARLLTARGLPRLASPIRQDDQPPDCSDTPTGGWVFLPGTGSRSETHKTTDRRSWHVEVGDQAAGARYCVGRCRGNGATRRPPPSRSFRLGFSGSAAGQGKKMGEALGIGRPRPPAPGGGPVIAAMAALVAGGFGDHAGGRASVVALMIARPGAWAVECGTVRRGFPV
jgi:hypothetical protein